MRSHANIVTESRCTKSFRNRSIIVPHAGGKSNPFRDTASSKSNEKGSRSSKEAGGGGNRGSSSSSSGSGRKEGGFAGAGGKPTKKVPELTISRPIQVTLMVGGVGGWVVQYVGH